jgi:predicted ATP-dependent endonuclease of OLD family
MKLKSLFIKEFKNLRDFKIDFSQESSTTVLVGQNGTGKSNLLEALTIIFRDLDLGESPTFHYWLEYECRGHQVSIKTFTDESDKRQFITADQKTLTYNQLVSQKEDFLPNFVFGYYSGPSNRMEEHFEKHQKRFYKDLLEGADKPLRPLFYARLVHSQFVLLTFFLEKDTKVQDFLKEFLRIEELDSVLFVLRQPPWTRNKNPLDFWGAKGVVRPLLNELYKLSLAPLQLKQQVSAEFQKNKLQHLYLYLKDVEGLRSLAKKYNGSQQALFKALESTYISKLISEVRIRVKARNIKGALTFRELSEGEQQLLMVLGLLRFTREDESLFLLDEPDTHLNPAWSLRYLNIIGDVVGEQPNSHIIMSTHDPLVIAGLTQSEVRIMRRSNEKDSKILAEMPEQDPKGMGVAGLLTSEIYGLKSQLDLDTQNLIDERTCLLAKGAKRTQKDDESMRAITQQLSTLGFMTSFKDPFYEEYAKAISSRPEFQKPILSKEEIQEQGKIANNIMKELDSKKRERKSISKKPKLKKAAK